MKRVGACSAALSTRWHPTPVLTSPEVREGSVRCVLWGSPHSCPLIHAPLILTSQRHSHTDTHARSVLHADTRFMQALHSLCRVLYTDYRENGKCSLGASSPFSCSLYRTEVHSFYLSEILCTMGVSPR